MVLRRAEGRFDDALVDAVEAIKLNEKWAKGYYRAGMALMGQQRWREAQQFLATGLKLAPNSVVRGFSSCHTSTVQ